MTNRLTQYFEGPRERPPPEDYWIVSGVSFGYAVSEETARHVLDRLDRIPAPRWLRFEDLFGSRVRVRSRDVEQVVEYTASQRAAGRAFWRARREEDQPDRPPWDDCL